MTNTEQEKTGLGNYFIANYPPFSFWKQDHLPQAMDVLHNPAKDPENPLGLYLHIPFCRKRCKFCYFRVYTDKNAHEIEVYLNALCKEIELYSQVPFVGDRPFKFVYFGGGTPSYLSATQLRDLMARLKAIKSWEGAEEVTFECEPGTLQQHKLEALYEMGISRLSLGIENFNYDILEWNGRAHRTDEIYRAYEWARGVGFNQINIDLIAGMVGETDNNWKDCVQKTIELSPESITIYQMELPYNTVFSKELKLVGENDPKEHPIADWPTKRRWVEEAFEELLKNGYVQSSAYTVVKEAVKDAPFVYRDSLWHGADMLGTGVASFGHVGGVHVQNVDTWEEYVGKLDNNEIPLNRAFPVKPDQLLIREMILQMKTGRLDSDYFENKFGVNVLERFQEDFSSLADQGFVTTDDGQIKVTKKGMLQVDRLLPRFFEPEHQSSRYT